MQRTLLLDSLRIDQVNRAKGVREFASGKAVNVARVAAAIGARAVVTGFAGGERGKSLCEDIQRSGIEHEMVMVAAPTRLCCTIIDQSNGTATELVEESAAVEQAGWNRLIETMDRLTRICKIWVFSGSLPPGVPIDTYARWCSAAAKLGAKMIVDARGEALRLVMQHPGMIVKVNREELAATIGKNFANEADLKKGMLLATPAGGAMIVTAGKEGSWVCDGKAVQYLAPPKIKVVNPIGSGDSYAAGVAVGLLRGLDLFEASRLGTACAAANTETADAGHVEKTRVEQLLGDIAIRENC